MTEPAQPASRTVDLDPVAAHYKRQADHFRSEALLLAAQLRDAVAMLKAVQPPPAEAESSQDEE